MDQEAIDKLLWRVAHAIEAGDPLRSVSGEGLLYRLLVLRCAGLVRFEPVGINAEIVLPTQAGLDRLAATRHLHPQRRAETREPAQPALAL